MLRAFSNAFLLQPPTVLARRLKHFSVGHHCLLSVLDSPFVSNGTAGLDDVLVVLEICSRTFEEGIEWLNSSTRESFAAFGEDLAKQSGGFFDFLTVSAILSDYFNLCMSMPDFWRSGSEGTSKLPTPLILSTSLMKLGFSESEAWNMPYGRAVWYAVAVNDRADAIQSEEEQYVLEHYDEIVNRIRNMGTNGTDRTGSN